MGGNCFIGHNKDFEYGICVTTCNCQQKKKLSKYKKVYKGQLVKLFDEEDKRRVFSLLTDKNKLFMPSDSVFHPIQPKLLKYLKAISDSEDRIKFYNSKFRDFVVNLKIKDVVSITIENEKVDGVVDDFVEENEKMFIVVELLNKPSSQLLKNLKKNTRCNKQNKFTLCCNMIQPTNSFDDDLYNRTIEKNLKIDKTTWECTVCSENNSNHVRKCVNCNNLRDDVPMLFSGCSMIDNNRFMSAAEDDKQAKTPNSLSNMNNERNQTKPFRLSVPANKIRKYKFDDTDQKMNENFEIDNSNLQCPTCGQQNLKNAKMCGRCYKANNLKVSELDSDSSLNDIVRNNNNSIVNTKQTSVLDIGKNSEELKIREDIIQSQIKPNQYNGTIAKQLKKSQNNVLERNEIRSNNAHTSYSNHRKLINGNIENFDLDKQNVTKHEETNTWYCSVCMTINPNDLNQCSKCDDERDAHTSHSKHRQSINENIENFDLDKQNVTRHEEKTNTWCCCVCTTINPNDLNQCSKCDDEREVKNVSKTYNAQTGLDSKLLVSVNPSAEVISDPYEGNKSEFDNYVTNEGGDLMEHHETPVISNSVPTKCDTCTNVLNVADGFILYLCKHTVCTNCIKNQMSNQNLKCLGLKNSEQCERLFQLSEIKIFLTTQQYEKFINYLIDLNEPNPCIKRCFNINCPGYNLFEKFYETQPTTFLCNTCKFVNCLECKVIHDGFTCKQYGKLTDDGKSIDKETVEMFLNWVRDGIAMPCPKCEALIEKDEGCDWVQCPFCNTEICWATRGPRWGPNGSGDTSGGCGCTKEKKCVETCNYCH